MKNFLFILLVVISFCTTGQSLKVMTYNIRYATEQDGVNEWKKRKSKVSGLIRKHDPDVIGLQEALLTQIEDLLNDLPEYDYIGVGRDDGKTKGEYSAILYRKNDLKVAEQNTFWLSETPESAGSKNWDAAITRVATWGKFTDVKSGRSFLFINTHFDHIGKEARKNSAALLKQKSQEIAKSLPVIITGDFNCTRDEPPYKTMMEDKTLVLKDPAPANPPGTYCTFEVNSTECRAIDYVFHSKEWVATNYQVISENDGKYYPSDHLPVTVDLSLIKK